jgi:hypothetical protein
MGKAAWRPEAEFGIRSSAFGCRQKLLTRTPKAEWRTPTLSDCRENRF